MLTEKQQQRISALFADDTHLEVEATWGVYQVMVSAYRDPDRAGGKRKMQQLIDSLSNGVPGVLVELRTVGRTLKQGRRHPGVLRPARHQQRADRGD